MVSGFAVLLLWRYAERLLNAVEPWLALHAPRTGRAVAILLRPRSEDRAAFLGVMLGVIPLAGLTVLLLGWAESVWLVPGWASIFLCDYLYRRSKIALSCVGTCYAAAWILYWTIVGSFDTVFFVFILIAAATASATIWLILDSTGGRAGGKTPS
jgi:hypothetical protein